MTRRKEVRTFVQIACRCHLPGGAARAAYVSDLSPHGCHMSMSDEDIEPGDRVEIELPAMAPLPAQIRWVRPDGGRMFVGAEFDTALHPALVEHFAAYCRIAV